MASRFFLDAVPVFPDWPGTRGAREAVKRYSFGGVPHIPADRTDWLRDGFASGEQVVP